MNELDDDEVLDIVVYEGQTYAVKYEQGLCYFELLDDGQDSLGLLEALR